MGSCHRPAQSDTASKILGLMSLLKVHSCRKVTLSGTITTQDTYWRILPHTSACSRSLMPPLISAASALQSFMHVWTQSSLKGMASLLYAPGLSPKLRTPLAHRQRQSKSRRESALLGAALN